MPEPASTPIAAFAEIDSTNSEAMRRALAGEPGPIWIRADVQTRGRGRSGRTWQSPSGNLYATLLFKPLCPAALVPQLSLVTGVAVHDTIISAGAVPGLRLKWPNDVLIGGAKVAGILAESLSASDGDVQALIGIGLNLSSSPADTDRAATHLRAHGIALSPAAALEALDRALSHWLGLWDRGKDFATVRAAWMERAGPSGEVLAVNAAGNRVEGRFAGLDADGALLLKDPDGGERRFTFGEVTVVPGTAEA